MINLLVNGKEVSVENGSTILEAAKKLKINIPTLCHMYMVDGKTRNCKGTCRVCVVEVEGKEGLEPACATLAREGMKVKTHTKRVINARKTVLQLLLSDHPKDCLKCEKNLNCELQSLASMFGIDGLRYPGEMSDQSLDISEGIVRDKSKCILCRRCVTACNEVQKVHSLTTIGRGFDTSICTFFSKPLNKTECTYCGQCVAVCPTGALREVHDYHKLWGILDDNKKTVVVQIAPAVRSALSEEFGLEAGTITTGKIVSALKHLAFDKVFDTNFAADLTIMEEAAEFVERFTSGNNLPLITSCCPAWVTFVEEKYPQNINLLSSCKSPQQMFGAIAKSYLVEKLGIKKEELVVVSVMPCIAKKVEAKRPEMITDGITDVDVVITTRELAKIIKESGIDIMNLEDEEFDNPLGEASGAGAIFGTSGGVMEAALRTAYEWVSGDKLESVDFNFARGLNGVKEAVVNIKDKEVKIAVVSSLGEAKNLMDEINAGRCNYDFIEVMACPGGCIDGGGQPFIKSNRDILQKRMDCIYEEDKNKEKRKSHENPMITKVYEEYLENTNSHLAHKLLHRNYKINKI
ncbi:NADH-dependent [FeFe] hydrogenase, group A6 [Clostridium sp.]|uniref:NADH-dependent [FeFe] hydrogenase, group A6 n=1 Tax=Clostridium sp. TaxID=1506 RepID=UPI003F3C11AC